MWIPILNLTLGYRSPDWATQPRAWLFTDWLVISANPGLNVSLVTFFCSKAYSWIIFTNTFRTSNKTLKAKWIKLNLLLTLSNLNSNYQYTPTLGYLNPALNSEAQGIIFPPLSGTKVIEHSQHTCTKQNKENSKHQVTYHVVRLNMGPQTLLRLHEELMRVVMVRMVIRSRLRGRITSLIQTI